MSEKLEHPTREQRNETARIVLDKLIYLAAESDRIELTLAGPMGLPLLIVEAKRGDVSRKFIAESLPRLAEQLPEPTTEPQA